MKENRLLFTQGFIERATTPINRCRYYDTKVQGLMLELMPTGNKIFRFRKKIKNKSQWATIGQFPQISLEQARDEAIRLSFQLTTGTDFAGLRQANKNESTLGELANFYFEQYANDRCQTAGEMKKDFTRWFADELDLHLSNINTHSVQLQINRLSSQKHYHRANKALDLIKAIFNWGIRQGLCKENPALKVDSFKDRVQSRERFIQPDEFPKLLAAISAYPDERIRDFLMLCLFTGSRCGKILSMKWEDVNLELATWLIGKDKNGESRYVALSDAALEILKHRHKNRGLLPFVFPGGRSIKRPTSDHLAEPKKAWTVIRNKAELPDLRIHDLRRTMGSYLAITGVNSPTIQKALGHKSLAAASVYQRVNNDPVKAGMNQAIRMMQQYAEVNTKKVHAFKKK